MRRWGDLKPFVAVPGHKKRRQMCPLHVAGLIGPGERKGIRPMAERLDPGRHDLFHHFIRDRLRDEGPFEAKHHHALMTMIACAFLQHRRLEQAAGEKSLRKGPPGPTRPQVRGTVARTFFSASPARTCPHGRRAIRRPPI